jgi:hypothetical protein
MALYMAGMVFSGIRPRHPRCPCASKSLRCPMASMERMVMRMKMDGNTALIAGVLLLFIV